MSAGEKGAAPLEQVVIIILIHHHQKIKINNNNNNNNNVIISTIRFIHVAAVQVQVVTDNDDIHVTTLIRAKAGYY